MAVSSMRLSTPSPPLNLRRSSGPNHSCARFICHSEGEAFLDGVAEIEFQPDGIQTPETLAKRVYFFNPRLEHALPTGDHLWRVIGTTREDLYALSGATTVYRLNHYLEANFDRPISSFRSILDWGCGAARLTRYLTNFSGPSITGIDIDRVNVQWAQDNVPGARFERVPVTPPTVFGDACFDLVIGTSVLTHLREDDQFRWLAELHRLTSPGALLFLTFVGDTVLGLKNYKEAKIAEIDEAGFLFGSINRSVQSGLDPDEGEFYSNVFHTADYVRREWGRYFDVLAIEPSLLELQDVAVLRRI